MYEPHYQKPIPRRHFVHRLILHFTSSVALISFSLFLGMIGYHYYEELPWLDAFLNSAMLLGGMGPVDSPQTNGGKLFAGLYALYAGLVFLIAASLIVAPALHRMLHLFHWEDNKEQLV
ncbi:MAG: two pore domain potassium channel family protein [Ignavibacteriales bacterium]|nr:MAG: two pore domain potassium channel family protein [Ignavibacteriales bacterium]